MHIVIHRAISLAFLCVGIAAAIAGCSKKEDSPVTPVKSTLPQPGSTFRFDRYDLDPAGDTIPGSQGETDITFLTTDIIFRSRDSVIAAADKNSSEVSYFRYEGTDGISLFLKRIESYGIPGVWVTLPVNGRPAIQKSIDTIATIAGAPMQVQIALSARPLGPEIFTVDFEQVEAQKIVIETVVTSKSGGTTLLSNLHTVWFAPTIGYFTKEDITLDLDPSLGASGGLRMHTVRALTGYALEKE